MYKHIFLFYLAICGQVLWAQEYFPNNESIQNKIENFTAFTNCKVYVTPTQIIEQATLLIQHGRVVQVGNKVDLPKNCIVVNLQGKSIYPSFIDMYSNFGIKKPASTVSTDSNPVYDTKRVGFYWNESIKSEVNAYESFQYDAVKAEEFLKAGFGSVSTHVQDGIARGTGCLVALNTADPKSRIIDNVLTNHLSFTKSATTKQEYPSSLMGSIALLRQLYLDTDWYKRGNAPTKDLSLEALVKNENLVQIFTAEDKLNCLRAAKIAREFSLKYIIKGSGDEFERVDEIEKTNSKFIIPINFPYAYDVSNPYLANEMELSDLRFWNQAPANLKVLSEHGITFALTTDKLKKIEDFRTNLLRAIQYGFDDIKALEALTTIPAALLGKSNEIGSLKIGSFANFIITSGAIFDRKTIFYENWVQGSKYVINDLNAVDIRGNYALEIGNLSYKWKIDGEIAAPKSEITTSGGEKISSKVSISSNFLIAIVKPKDSISLGFIRISGSIKNTAFLRGKAILYDGSEVQWNATKTGNFEKLKDSTSTEKSIKVVPVTFPNIAYGNLQKPTQQAILFKNATVWTNEKEGILKTTDVLVKNGKIASIGLNISDAAARIVDAAGKHLTCGIIDEHSHIAISNGVNESGHNSTAEVTIEDVVNSEDGNIYRELAGGVTTSQLLHGSANPIGGRSAIVKWKWGMSPDEMLYQNAPKFIKFALGENVKQSNWGIESPTRFPQTRMGVEQVFIDYFQRAKEYDLTWQAYNSLGKKDKQKEPRVDIELQTIAEILNKERFITCHSYVQSEILMLMNVTEKFNFPVNTFTHILEGYKVADKMKKHGAGASTFSDWWAYKFEVNDAIPHNGGIMHNEGITVAFNSDDAEMSRRLNQEAAKAVKYSAISEEDAWKFVTLNPAKLLHIEDKVGSIKVGKDADLVLWNDNPLSVYARVEQTMIEGVVYFNIEEDKQHRLSIASEKNDLINQMLIEKNKGMITQEPKKKEKKHYHCDTEGQ